MDALARERSGVAWWADLPTVVHAAKPRIVALFVLTVVAAMLLAGGPAPARAVLVVAALGVTVAGAALLNSALERRTDALMERTRGRATASGVLPARRAVGIGVALVTAGLAGTWAGGGALAAALAAVGAAYYVLVYTLLLKPRSAYSSVPGAIAGVFPALAGWAASGEPWSTQLLVLCLVIVAWSPPHFWALALARADDYRRSGVPTPVARGGERGTALLVAGCDAALVALTLGAAGAGVFGWVYLAPALPASLLLGLLAARLALRPSAGAAWLLFKASGPWLAVIVVAMVLDSAL
jgi:protoheme IX farnesyltransferase